LMANTNSYRKTVMKNGLRVLSERMPSIRSISLGVWIDVGSRYETPSQNGVSHLIEHMMFKGTKRRSAKQVASSLESIGGALNAFTSREQTCYTARILDEHLSIAVDVLADISGNSILSPMNLKREKLVVCEEIKESIDNPSDHIHDIFAEAFWGSHALGQPILGTIEPLTKMPRSRILKYISDNYKNGSIVIAASGAVSHDKLVRLVRKHFHYPDGQREDALEACRNRVPAIKVESTDSDQVHICVGHPGLAFADQDKYTALVLCMYLGGGMSSVLFQKIREERGLAYTVYTYNDFYSDGGIFCTYAATDRTHLEKAFEIIMAEYKRIKNKQIVSTRLDKVKQQLKGQLMLGLEATSSRMSRLARQELMYGEAIPLSKTLKDIDNVTPSAVRNLANRLLDNSQIAVAVLGPADKRIFEGLS